MKNLITILFLTLLTSTIAFSQKNFEGILEYKIEMRDKTGEMSADDVKQFMGTKQTYYSKGNKYKGVLNGMLALTIYHEGNDTIFTKMNGQSVVMYELTNVSDEEVISHEITKSDTKILGYSCNVMKIKTNKGRYTFYYNENLSYPKGTHINHKYGMWAFFSEKTNSAVPLYGFSETEDNAFKITLTSIKEEKLDDAIFVKPDLPIIKMPKN